MKPMMPVRPRMPAVTPANAAKESTITNVNTLCTRNSTVIFASDPPSYTFTNSLKSRNDLAHSHFGRVVFYRYRRLASILR
ncbi:hypothetical protein ACTXT7_000238 [Hymenolepis weldensis]